MSSTNPGTMKATNRRAMAQVALATATATARRAAAVKSALVGGMGAARAMVHQSALLQGRKPSARIMITPSEIAYLRTLVR